MSGLEVWRFHDDDSAINGPCRRFWCLACWRFRIACKAVRR